MTVALHPAARPMSDTARVRPASARPSRPALPPRLGLLTPHNPHDRRAFSGTVFHAVRALAARTDLRLTVLGPHRPATALDRLLRRGSPRFEPAMLAPDGSDFAGLDAVLGLVASPLLDAAARLTDLPFVHVTDATPGFLREIYGRDLPEGAAACEARVLARSTAVYSSRIMADIAGAEFGAAAAGARALAFGVNFTTLPGDRSAGLPAKAPLDRLEVLFVGGDWDRKGGALALAAFERLRASGRDAHLTLVGGVPAPVRTALQGRSDISVAGFLDKNRPREQARLAALFARAHLFVLPTRADCTPMVVAEALAHGTPVLATDIGGTREMIGQGAGRTLPMEAGAADWARAIGEMGSAATAHAMMSDAAAERTVRQLNWDCWAAGIAAIAAETAFEGARAAA